jgi:N-acetylmuramoyl-L-alanine amidase
MIFKLTNMKVANHLLFDNNNKQFDFKPTPNRGRSYTPQYLIMHYTAATEAKGSISWFLNKKAEASAHLLIDRDGSITQFAPFNVVCWHAGDSRWNGLVGMNKFSIGIELVNGGRLQRSGASWICVVDKRAVPDNEVIIARHKNEHTENGWHAYTDVQLQVAAEIAALLVKQYVLKDVLGHDDISPFRKSDPGPAFPMASFRSRAMGRRENEPVLFKTSTDVNIRSGAGTQFATVSKPLPKNTQVQVLKREGNWSFVDVMGVVHGLNDIEGWIASKLLVQV